MFWFKCKQWGIHWVNQCNMPSDTHNNMQIHHRVFIAMNKLCLDPTPPIATPPCSLGGGWISVCLLREAIYASACTFSYQYYQFYHQLYHLRDVLLPHFSIIPKLENHILLERNYGWLLRILHAIGTSIFCLYFLIVPTVNVDTKVHIFTDTGLGRCRMTSPTLDRLY